MKNIVSVLAIYVLTHSAAGDSVRSYEGQSKQTIQSLLVREGKSGEFITQSQYQAFIKTHQPIQPSDTELKRQVDDKTDLKKILNDHSETSDQRLNALIKYLGL